MKILIFSIFDKDYGDTSFITGMRAFAAFGVVLIHAGGAGFRELGSIGNNLVDFGQAGVNVFFVISGFSVSASYETAKGYWDYINKRLWRIAPLYYFWIIAAVALTQASMALKGDSSSSQMQISFYNWAMHFLFLGFLDYEITNSIIGVEWSISVEVFWYFLLPILIFLARTLKSSFALILTSLIFYQISQKYSYMLPVPSEMASTAMHWSPIPYLLTFSLGVAAYKIRELVRPSGIIADAALVFSLFMVILYICNPYVSRVLSARELVFVSFLTFILLVSGTKNSYLFRKIFCNQASQMMGVISYGVYLSHVPLMGLLVALDLTIMRKSFYVFLLVSLLAVLVSMFTYIVIEKKFNKIGQIFGARIV